MDSIGREMQSSLPSPHVHPCCPHLPAGKPSTLEIPEGPLASEAPATPGVTLHQPRQATSPGSVTSENAPTPGDKESEIGSPRSHAIQGERVQVERLGGPGEAALAAVGEGEEITTVDARPDFEVESMAAADVASIKQQEAALVVRMGPRGWWVR